MSRTIKALSSAHQNIANITKAGGRIRKFREEIPEIQSWVQSLKNSNIEQTLKELSIEHPNLNNNAKYQGLTKFIASIAELEEELGKIEKASGKISTLTNKIDRQTIPEIAQTAKKEIPGISTNKTGDKINNKVIETILNEKQASQIQQTDAKIEFQNSNLTVVYQSDYNATIKGDVHELIEEMFDNSNDFFVFQGSGNFGLAQKTYIIRKSQESPKSNTIMDQAQRQKITIDAKAKIKFHNPYLMEINQALCHKEQQKDAYELAKTILKDSDFLVFKGDDESDRTQKIYIVKEPLPST